MHPYMRSKDCRAPGVHICTLQRSTFCVFSPQIWGWPKRPFQGTQASSWPARASPALRCTRREGRGWLPPRSALPLGRNWLIHTRADCCALSALKQRGSLYLSLKTCWRKVTPPQVRGWDLFLLPRTGLLGYTAGTEMVEKNRQQTHYNAQTTKTETFKQKTASLVASSLLSPLGRFFAHLRRVLPYSLRPTLDKVGECAAPYTPSAFDTPSLWPSSARFLTRFTYLQLALLQLRASDPALVPLAL